jgi:hypothetical protein
MEVSRKACRGDHAIDAARETGRAPNVDLLAEGLSLGEAAYDADAHDAAWWIAQTAGMDLDRPDAVDPRRSTHCWKRDLLKYTQARRFAWRDTGSLGMTWICNVE